MVRKVIGYPQEQKSLNKEQKETIGLLSIGTFLEYFDLMIYIHMAVFLNALFFPTTDPHTTALYSAGAFCATYILRPLGALIFGWIGDNIGRKPTVIITTFMMSSACIVMANLPTYEQIGSIATWVAIICRAVQGMSSMGEIVGAELYLTEMLHPPIQYASVGLIGSFAVLGTLGALGIVSLVISYAINWRIAFWMGAAVAFVGYVARTKLREAPEFADAKRRLKRVFKITNTDINILQHDPIWQEKVNKKTLISFFLLQCALPVCVYFIYIYCGNILKTSFGYTLSEVIQHNFLVCLMELLTTLILCYLSLKIYPLLIMKIILLIFSIFMIFCPYLLNNLDSPYQLFLIQFFIVLWKKCISPATPIFLKSFPVLKRFTCASMTFAVSRALMYVISSFGFVYLTEYFGNWGMWFIMIPIIIGFSYGLSHFENLVKLAKITYSKKCIV
ncbi:MFS transporter [Candidatus Tisiphia endosymbiont of Oplodontha viridula]|uniref:MFS transporter n=1 Tax=Candidatus Tisiphia endosymbiont of Oplodontha viridula TaxID=3077925 RepID=UPI0035C90E64